MVVAVHRIVILQERAAGGDAELPSASGPVEKVELVRVIVARAFGPRAGVDVGLSASTVGTMERVGRSRLCARISRAGAGLGGSGGCGDPVRSLLCPLASWPSI